MKTIKLPLRLFCSFSFSRNNRRASALLNKAELIRRLFIALVRTTCGNKTRMGRLKSVFHFIRHLITAR